MTTETEILIAEFRNLERLLAMFTESAKSLRDAKMAAEMASWAPGSDEDRAAARAAVPWLQSEFESMQARVRALREQVYYARHKIREALTPEECLEHGF